MNDAREGKAEAGAAMGDAAANTAPGAGGAAGLSARQRMVIDCFDGGGVLLTREDIAARTHLRLSSVCGRVRELLDAGYLQVRGLRRCAATGKPHELLGRKGAR
ncbi:hypothetical protein [Cupriavidus sp. USMAHM13]|uniref:hypothetical protein n=1 Tax=Cupriavidus sp. USMAHM13 TaxID=1389192 RepID=UPI0012E9BE13|nr:hypothetical protein [Cupriavidus sp. USMAHM13]